MMAVTDKFKWFHKIKWKEPYIYMYFHIQCKNTSTQVLSYFIENTLETGDSIFCMCNKCYKFILYQHMYQQQIAVNHSWISVELINNNYDFLIIYTVRILSAIGS